VLDDSMIAIDPEVKIKYICDRLVAAAGLQITVDDTFFFTAFIKVNCKL
jgi:hypothetical protein